VAGFPRFLSFLSSTSSEAGRVAAASVSGLSALVSSLATGSQRPIPVHLLPNSNGEPPELADTAQVELAAKGPWSAARLRETLRTHLENDRVIVLANREPCIHQRGGDGEIVVQHPASGLVTALEPVMRACSGVWVAHGSGTADRESSDARGRVEVSTGDGS